MGGTFDPVHNGHLAVARVAKARLDLDRVIFVPAGRPWLKSDRPITAAEHRLEMVRLAVSDRPDFVVSRIEVDRAGPTYTVDTIAELRRRYASGDEFFFLVGWDILEQLPRWHQAARFVRLCRLAVLPRPGYNPPDLKGLEAAIPGIAGRVVLLDMPEMNISATDIRQRAAGGLPIGQLVPAAVAKYIADNGLYQS